MPICALLLALMAPLVQTPAAEAVPADAIRIKVSGAGYEPARIDIKSGAPVKLAFYRADAKNCGDVVDFPSLHIKKELPAGKTTVVELPAMQKGTLAFGCGMGMMKGELVVTVNGK
jgi:Cu+-exporting ATPase